MTIKKLTILLILLLLAGCATSPNGPNSAPAAASTVINGVEFWTEGAPSRPYQVIATISKQGADNSATVRDEENLIADDATQRGADAVIVLDTVMVVARNSVIDSRPVMAPKVDAQLIKYQ
jgi:ABC-type glycerol-3-phosphate transport system substrate-binding protein